MADLEQFTLKGKPVTYIGAFVELYKRKNHRQVYEIHGMIELKKMYALITENPRNLSASQISKIFLILRNTYVVPKDQNNIVFYVNNYIDWDHFNQLYDLDWMEKGIRNTDVLAHKLGPVLTRVSNQRLKVVKEEKQKREEMVEKRKTEAMTIKRRRARGEMSLSSEEKENYESDTGDKTDLD